MPDYKKMYLTLFDSQTKAIQLLQKAQQITEEIFVSEDDAEPSLLTEKKGNDKKEGD